MNEPTSLEKIVADTPRSSKKVAAVDTFSNITYTTVVGAVLDALSGLNLSGIVAARIASCGTNVLTSAPYGWWTEKVYHYTKTNESAGFVRKRVVDLLAFNTFQIPVYATVLAVGTLVSEGEINIEKVKNGAENLFYASPFIGPTLGWYMASCRRIFGLRTTAEGAYKRIE
ncbi:L-alanine exporter AlaE [Candidatus Woesearchaeota archaeon]|nr:L-alanine exporter AlaE [Candidatus Woesearchaeota archaeon]